MLCCVMFLNLSVVLAVQKDQSIAFWNVAATLLQRTPDSAVQDDLRHAVEIGVAGQLWLYGLFAAIAASAIVGWLVVGLTPWTQAGKPRVEQ